MDLKEALHTRVVKVKFTKVNGDIREMICTQDFSKIPADKHPKEKPLVEGEEPKPVKVSDTIRVFDLEKGEWRSFKLGSVIESVIL